MTGRLLREVHYATESIGRRVELYDSLPSTNDVPKTWLRDEVLARAGTMIVAGFQTAGRGQYGRVWQAEPWSSLLASVVLSPPLTLQRPVLLTAWVAVAIVRAVEQLSGVRPDIKWPNDLLVEGRKLCGILIEQSPWLVAGFGLNVTQSVEEFATAGFTATSLSQIAGKMLSFDDVLTRVVLELDRAYTELLEERWAALESEWVGGLNLVGHQVMLQKYDGTVFEGL
ncbi:MAG: biotin--[acetyl-CoA-carboxylase] ligase, partial [Gemmataceae bacterium]